jgi:ribonucleoside-diphosphate reductase alpha chain
MEAVRRMEIMPSMRVMMTAGPALEKHNVAGYNCSYTPVDHPKKFSEILYILMCGTGLGFSVEREYVNKLPDVPEELHESDTVIKVRDSKLGWASAYRELIQMLYGGRVPKWDTSKVRPAGARLKTFGGRASGPEPLEDLFRFTVSRFKEAAGRKLTTLEVHDIVCKIAEIVVVGGVRRSALISLSNLSDDRLRHAKSGQWWLEHPHRALSNNSVAYTIRPDMDSFIRELQALYESRAGERGIYNRQASKDKYPETHRRDENHDFGCNPCSEIILRPDQFCNLTEVIVRPDDTQADIELKIKHATFLGTLQSTLTDFKFLSSKWENNCEEERLLGVSLTGVLDHPILGGKCPENDGELYNLLEVLRECAVAQNRYFSNGLGIPQSAAVTCVKPSGTVSQLCDTASGLHPRYAEYYIRRVRMDNKDPLCKFLVDKGVHNETDVANPHSVVFSFPCKAPEGSQTQQGLSSIRHMEIWRIYNRAWCEHKPSITVSYHDDEFLALGAYVWEHFDEISGVSFLPRTDAVYQQAPYEACTEEEYNALKESNPEAIDWSELEQYENEDNTTVQPELACTAGVCEL